MSVSNITHYCPECAGRNISSLPTGEPYNTRWLCFCCSAVWCWSFIATKSAPFQDEFLMHYTLRSNLEKPGNQEVVKSRRLAKLMILGR